MSTTTWIETFDPAERLRYVDAQIAAFCERREQEAAAREAAATTPPPAIHGVRVFLRGPGEDGQFGTLTTTRRVVPRQR